MRQMSQHGGSLVLGHPHQPFAAGCCFHILWAPVKSTKAHLWLPLMGITMHQRHLSKNDSSSLGAVRTFRNEALHWLWRLTHCDMNTKTCGTCVPSINGCPCDASLEMRKEMLRKKKCSRSCLSVIWQTKGPPRKQFLC